MNAITYERRKVTNLVMLGLCTAAAFLAIGILALILGFVLFKGISAINLDFLSLIHI